VAVVLLVLAQVQMQQELEVPEDLENLLVQLQALIQFLLSQEIQQ
tara:strand:+ start:62 stop:196 length:135 start_codon:yes stop_codon:yes gene_type:complete